MATTEADAKEGEATVAVVTAAVAMSAVTMVVEVTVVEVAAAEKSAVEATVAVARLVVGKIVSVFSPRLPPRFHLAPRPHMPKPETTSTRCAAVRSARALPRVLATPSLEHAVARRTACGHRPAVYERGTSKWR